MKRNGRGETKERESAKERSCEKRAREIGLLFEVVVFVKGEEEEEEEEEERCQAIPVFRETSSDIRTSRWVKSVQQERADQGSPCSLELLS